MKVFVLSPLPEGPTRMLFVEQLEKYNLEAATCQPARLFDVLGDLRQDHQPLRRVADGPEFAFGVQKPD